MHLHDGVPLYAACVPTTGRKCVARAENRTTMSSKMVTKVQNAYRSVQSSTNCFKICSERRVCSRRMRANKLYTVVGGRMRDIHS